MCTWTCTWVYVGIPCMCNVCVYVYMHAHVCIVCVSLHRYVHIYLSCIYWGMYIRSDLGHEVEGLRQAGGGDTAGGSGGQRRA